MDSYQAIYDAVRSRISGGNVSDAVTQAVREAFDISYTVQMLAQEFAGVSDAQRKAALEQQRPSVLFRPKLSADGNMWCALYGENLQIGVAGFGETPEAAMAAFDVAWLNERTPAARFATRAVA